MFSWVTPSINHVNHPLPSAFSHYIFRLNLQPYPLDYLIRFTERFLIRFRFCQVISLQILRLVEVDNGCDTSPWHSSCNDL
ncbi:hypothetical protein L6452_33516 [Arctium lappa]|uniref:Uncharacterized protein n=1 Tax=Arctium lappa TaxID=4217 RepID=A0ACB8YJU2_ARCLA|nr:hypothetical protein L6452_33516 [Arctium lappa]